MKVILCLQSVAQYLVLNKSVEYKMRRQGKGHRVNAQASLTLIITAWLLPNQTVYATDICITYICVPIASQCWCVEREGWSTGFCNQIPFQDSNLYLLICLFSKDSPLHDDNIFCPVSVQRYSPFFCLWLFQSWPS